MSTIPATSPAPTPTAGQTLAAQAAAVINPTPKLTASVHSYLDLTLKAGRKFESLIEQAQADQKALGYNRDQCRVVLQTAFKLAFEKIAQEQKLPKAEVDAFVTTGLEKEKFNISKVLTLASPKTDEAKVELEKAREAGLGINAQLEVARGNATTASIQAERANKAAGNKPETARPPSGNTPTKPQPPTPETPQTQKLTPKERITNQLAGVIKLAESDDFKLSPEEVLALLEDYVATLAAEREEAAGANAKQS